MFLFVVLKDEFIYYYYYLVLFANKKNVSTKLPTYFLTCFFISFLFHEGGDEF